MAFVNEGTDDSFRQWNEIPTWDGQAHTLKRFTEDVEWWLESLDEAATLKYNLAARFVRKQRGKVQRIQPSRSTSKE